MSDIGYRESRIAKAIHGYGDRHDHDLTQGNVPRVGTS